MQTTNDDDRTLERLAFRVVQHKGGERFVLKNGNGYLDAVAVMTRWKSEHEYNVVEIDATLFLAAIRQNKISATWSVLVDGWED